MPGGLLIETRTTAEYLVPALLGNARTIIFDTQ